jgi:hypothetical protein
MLRVQVLVTDDTSLGIPCIHFADGLIAVSVNFERSHSFALEDKLRHNSSGKPYFNNRRDCSCLVPAPRLRAMAQKS